VDWTKSRAHLRTIEMYQLIEKNDNYEIGILYDLVCLRFTPEFDRVLGDDRGRGQFGKFGKMVVRSETYPMLDGEIYLPGTDGDRDTRVAEYRPDNPTEYAEKLKEALAAYVESKQPFKKGEKYWFATFYGSELTAIRATWLNDSADRKIHAVGRAFKTEEECKAFIEKTKEFWRSLK